MKETNWFTKYIPIGTLLIFTSACQTIHYTARYDIKSKDSINSQGQTAKKIISHLANKYDLKEDKKYNTPDTIGYFGRPYHYFKFTFDNNGQIDGAITLDYWGVSSRKNTYREFLNTLTDSIQTNFTILKRDIKETK